MSIEIAVTGTSVKHLDRIGISVGLAQLGNADASGAVAVIITEPKGSPAAKFAWVRQRLFDWPNRAFVKALPRGRGLAVCLPGECPAIDHDLPYVVYTGRYSFEWVYQGVLTKPDGKGGKPVPLEVDIRGQACVGSMPAMLARAHEELGTVLSHDWSAARQMHASPLAESIGQHTYAEHKVSGLPGRTGVTQDSKLWRELQEAVDGVLAQLKQAGNVFSFEDVRVYEVRPPEDIRKQEQAQEALVHELSASIASSAGEGFGIRSRILEGRKVGSLDAENAARLVGLWEKRAEEHLALAIRATTDPDATRVSVKGVPIPEDRKAKLEELLAARVSELKEQKRHQVCGDLLQEVRAAALPTVLAVLKRIAEEACITDDDRRKLLNMLEDRRISLWVAEIQRLISVSDLDTAEAAVTEAKLPDGDAVALAARIQEERERIKDEAEARDVSEFMQRFESAASLEALDTLWAEVLGANIASQDRVKMLKARFAQARFDLERVLLLTAEQRPRLDEFAERIPSADREALTLIAFQVERAGFVPGLLEKLRHLMADRDQELRDELESRVQAEVERRTAEVDVQARVVIAASEDAGIRSRLDAAAALLNHEETRTQAAIALRAASASDRGVRDGFLADAAAAGLLGPVGRTAIGPSASEDQTKASAPPPGRSDGRLERPREPHDRRAHRGSPSSR